jgi:hypothetical protein
MFGPNRRQPDGRFGWCRPCAAADSRERAARRRAAERDRKLRQQAEPLDADAAALAERLAAQTRLAAEAVSAWRAAEQQRAKFEGCADRDAAERREIDERMALGRAAWVTGCCGRPLHWDRQRAWWRIAHEDDCPQPWQPKPPEWRSLPEFAGHAEDDESGDDAGEPAA